MCSRAVTRLLPSVTDPRCTSAGAAEVIAESSQPLSNAVSDPVALEDAATAALCPPVAEYRRMRATSSRQRANEPRAGRSAYPLPYDTAHLLEVRILRACNCGGEWAKHRLIYTC